MTGSTQWELSITVVRSGIGDVLHTDHSHAVTSMIKHIRTQPIIYVPRGTEAFFEQYIDSSLQLSALNRSKTSIHPVVGVSSHSAPVSIAEGRFEVRAFAMTHSIICYGYGLYQCSHRLKEEHRGKSGAELRDLRQQQLVEITTRVCTPVLAYVCDTTIDAFRTSPELLTFAYVVVECTFFRDRADEIRLAEDSKHIHWNQLRPLIMKTPDSTFILIHFSMRYTVEEIEDFFKDEQKQHVLPNIVVWTN